MFATLFPYLTISRDSGQIVVDDVEGGSRTIENAMSSQLDSVHLPVSLKGKPQWCEKRKVGYQVSKPTSYHPKGRPLRGEKKGSGGRHKQR